MSNIYNILDEKLVGNDINLICKILSFLDKCNICEKLDTNEAIIVHKRFDSEFKRRVKFVCPECAVKYSWQVI